jgi:hypothetical protein
MPPRCREKLKPWEKQFTRKSLHRNDLPCSRLHEFYVKWDTFGSDHGTEQGHIEHACGPWDGEERHGSRFLFRPTKSAFSIFEAPKSGFFVKRLSRNRKLGTTPHINNIPPKIHISAFISLRKPSEGLIQAHRLSCPIQGQTHSSDELTTPYVPFFSL